MTVVEGPRKELIQRVKSISKAEREELLRLAMPRIVDDYFTHIPHPKQQVFLSLMNREAMYGGAAGGGKSDALLMSALQFVDVPGYSALILRRTWPDLNSPGAILDRAKLWLNGTDVHFRDAGRQMIFPSGARIHFGYMAREIDKYKFQSAEYQFVGFDELTQFPESQYTYLFSRIRRPELQCLNCGHSVRKYDKQWKHTSSSSKCKKVFPDPKVIEQYPPSKKDGLSVFDIPLRMRSATNPGGIGHEWVRSRFVDPRTRVEDSVFVPARLTDNPSLDQTSYIENLEHLSPTDRERLLAGDWDVSEEGEMFDRTWFNSVDQVPVTHRQCRFWDHASTADGGDYTVGALLKLHEGRWYLEDLVRGQWSSHQKKRVILQTALADGPNVPVRMEQEPGSSGKDVIDMYRRDVLVGYNFDGVPSTGSKEARAAPFAAAAQAGNFFIKIAPWNVKFLDEASMFPLGANDDQIDAVSGAMSFISHGFRSRLIV